MRLDMYYSFIFLSLTLGKPLCTTFCIESFGYVNKNKLLKSPRLTNEFVQTKAFKEYQMDFINLNYYYNKPLLKNFNNRLISIKIENFEKKKKYNLLLELNFLNNLFFKAKYMPILTGYFSNIYFYNIQTKHLLVFYKKFYKFLIVVLLIKFKFLFYKLLKLRTKLLMSQMLKLIIS